MPLLQALVFFLLLTLPSDSPEPEQVVVSQYRIVRGMMAETRHNVTRNECWKILHLINEVEVIYEQKRQ